MEKDASAAEIALYHVFRAEGGWIIRFEGRHYGHPTLTSAIKEAIGAARASAVNGYESQVLVRMPDGAWNVSWASQDDFRSEGGPAATRHAPGSRDDRPDD